MAKGNDKDVYLSGFIVLVCSLCLNQEIDGLNQEIDGLNQEIDCLNQEIDGVLMPKPPPSLLWNSSCFYDRWHIHHCYVMASLRVGIYQKSWRRCSQYFV